MSPVFVRPPSKPTTRVEVVVMIWAAIALSLALGAYCLWIGFHAPPEMAEYGSRAKLYGVALLAAGPLLWLGHRLIARLLHR